MGYTEKETDIIGKYLNGSIKNILDFGSQNDYRSVDKNPPFVNKFYEEHGIYDYVCIDLAGDNNSIKLNWSYPISDAFTREFDLVVDAGSSEHSAQSDSYIKTSFHEGYINSVYPEGEINIDEGYYNCWLNKHNLLKIGGIMVNVNPKQGNWPDHGYSYISEDFYRELVKMAGYEILELGEWAACGNVESGWNIYCVIKKVSDTFPSFDEFKTLDIKNK